ncbi:MAG: hypothetical protein E7355_01885 [Clostridiales bacterium]|nr:hypothetical protein [Clostridiales bacterium]
MTKDDEKRLQKEREEAKERERVKKAKEILEDFTARREARRNVESGWILNMNFFAGNQYCDVSPFGGVVAEDKQFYWQSRRVFNHIAPMVDSRIAKLEKLRPVLSVRAFSDEEGDIKAAKLATGVLQYAQDRIGFAETVSRCTVWSETCGSGFYKIAWDEQGGRQVAVDEAGNPVYEGEVTVTTVSPFEMYPDRLDVEGIEELESLIHAQAVSADYVFERFGVAVKEQDLDGQTACYSEPSAGKLPLQTVGVVASPTRKGVLLIERYTRPCEAFPAGRLEIVAGNTLVYEGDLPYCNGDRGERTFPFVKQDCLRLPAAFFGSSVIDRLIPVQRAYNAVRNRKHEFLNRSAMGVLTVEDGSVDTDELTEEGLLPGKVLVYRQGGKAPAMLDCGSVPAEFAAEEEWLEKEFSLISGVSDLSQNSTPTRVTSATGLQLLLAQDETRLSATLGSLERAIKGVGKQILRLYKQFAGSARLMTLAGENKKTQVHYFNAADLDVSDLQFDCQDGVTPEEKKSTILRLYEAGLLTDEDGKMSTENKNRVLEAFGFGSLENARDISALHIAKAGEENLLMKKEEILPDDYDEHSLHITEHTRFLLSSEFKKCQDKEGLKRRYVAHIAAHKAAAKKQALEEK